MLREAAIAVLATHELQALTKEQRESLLGEWWESDDENGDPMDPRRDPLLRTALAHRYVGVINTYLEKRMTLGEGRANFSKLGAVTERVVVFVLPDGKERYRP